LNGDGLQTRDFVFVDDVVDALILAKEKTFCGELNIATSVEINLLDVISAIEKSTGEKLNYTRVPGKPGEQRRSCLSYQKAQKILGYTPKVNLSEGIVRTVEWTKNNYQK